LNNNPDLPYDDASFDVITCVVSIDYLIFPLDVSRECHRILRPGGKMLVSQSNRCFPKKVIRMWKNLKTDLEHLELINGYFQYASSNNDWVEPRRVYNITAVDPSKGSKPDPMYVVVAEKK
jgi:SAM-dependent methyltransferase